MPPQRDIEKLLKAAAEERRRRAGAPFELHPATRRMLQGEVTRQFNRPARGGSFLAQGLMFLRTRLAFATITLVVLSAGSIWLGVWRNSAKRGEPAPTTFALNQPAAGEGKDVLLTPPAAPAPAAPEAGDALNVRLRDLQALDKRKEAPAVVAPAAAPAVVFAYRSPGDTGIVQTREAAQAKPLAPAPGAAFGGAVSLATTAAKPDDTKEALAVAGRVGGGQLGESLGRLALSDAVKRPAEESKRELAATAPVDALRQADDLASRNSAARPEGVAGAPAEPARAAFARRYFLPAVSPEGLTQRFAQVPAVAMEKKSLDRSSPAPAVLATFQLEQDGDRLRIVDSDGSAYVGTLQPAPPAAEASGAVGGTLDAPAASGGQRSGGLAGSPLTSEVPALARASTQPVAQSVSAASQVYFFRVAGTNLTLQQPLVFAGTLTADAPAAASDERQKVSARGAAPASSRLTIDLGLTGSHLTLRQLSTARIQGEAVVGKNRKLQVEASPAPPR